MARRGTKVDSSFAALADGKRRAVIGLLRKRPYKAGELAAALNLEPASLSRHLRILRNAGLITDAHPDDDARVRLYQLNPRAFADLRSWLDEVEHFWTQQLAAFREQVERDNRGNA
ncbi:MAG: metalloregulator ArsR/SmtB family transcription factor [Steroidobacteraceae bacterium]